MEQEKKGPGRERDAIRRAASPLLLAAVKKAAAAIPSEVELAFFGSDDFPSASLDTLQIIQVLADSGPKIRLGVHDAQNEKALCAELKLLFFPALIIQGRNRGSMRFLGTPSGYGLQILVEALAAASTGEAGLTPAICEKLGAIRSPVELKLFISPESEYCRRSANFAFCLAVESSRIRTELINHIDFPLMSRRYKIGNTPRMFVNEKLEINGARGGDEYIERILGAMVPQAEMHR